MNCLDNEDSFEIVDIYFNSTLQDNTIVETKYQVFVEFSYENSYGGREKDRVLYILTPYESEYLIESNDEYLAMYNIAEMEIYSIGYDKWETYSNSQIEKIERKAN